jgi:hypothetical protein
MDYLLDIGGVRATLYSYRSLVEKLLANFDTYTYDV